MRLASSPRRCAPGQATAPTLLPDRVQAVDQATDALRTGAYAKTLTFTLSTSNP